MCDDGKLLVSLIVLRGAAIAKVAAQNLYIIHAEELGGTKMESGTGRLQAREASIVLVGGYDPLMLVPQWFVNHGLIPSEDLQHNVAIEIIYKDLTRFTLPNIVVEVSTSRVSLRSDNQSLDFQIVDMAAGILNALPKVEVTAIGLNLHEDYFFEEKKVWDGVGDLLVPKDFWYELMPDSPKAGLASLQMQVAKPSPERGHYNFSVIWMDKPGWTRFQTNDHYDAAQVSLGKGSKYELVSMKHSKFDPLSIVLSGWEASRQFHSRAVQTIFNQAAGAYHHGHG